MGIRNLAYCLIEHELGTTGKFKILAWDNIDLLEGGASSQNAKKCACGGKAAYTSVADGRKWCTKCAHGKPKKGVTTVPGLPTIPCALAVKPLRTLLTEAGVDAKKMKKEDLIAWVAARYLMPWKPAKTMSIGMDVILSAMDTWLDSVMPLFARASVIRLENQPAMKIPTMKSVQMILFTLLSHRLAREHAWKGRIDFVHASVKTRGKELVDISGSKASAEAVAYTARKRTAEEAVADILKGETVWLAYFNGKTKKSDLADAFLMAHRTS